MHLDKTEVISRLKVVFGREKTICRLIAAWSLYAMLNLLTVDGKFYELSFAQDASLGAMILWILWFFTAMSAISFFHRIIKAIWICISKEK